METNTNLPPDKSKFLNLLLGVVCIFWLIVMCAFLSPQIQYRAGNLFFGEIPALYNLTIAQAFYTYAAYPLIGNAPEFAHYQLSRTYFIKGWQYEALKEAEKELELYPDNKRTYYILGLTYGYMNQEREAIEAFSKFIEAYPDSWAARNDSAWLQFRIGDIEGALQTIEPVSNLENPWVLNTYGTLLLNSGSVLEAKEVFLRAQAVVLRLSADDWGSAYPGNDPRVYDAGLMGMKNSIEENLAIVERLLLSPNP